MPSFVPLQRRLQHMPVVKPMQHPDASASLTWNPRSTGYPLLSSVSVCPPHSASLSKSVTRAPFLQQSRVCLTWVVWRPEEVDSKAVGGGRAGRGRWSSGVDSCRSRSSTWHYKRLDWLGEHNAHLFRRKAADSPLIPLPTMAMRLPCSSSIELNDIERNAGARQSATMAISVPWSFSCQNILSVAFTCMFQQHVAIDLFVCATGCIWALRRCQTATEETWPLPLA